MGMVTTNDLIVEQLDYGAKSYTGVKFWGWVI